jgi:tRNA threonylcarbamoyladenosine biosynthesis protein TsaE
MIHHVMELAYSVEEIDKIIFLLEKLSFDHWRLILYKGPMGAGKTTLIKALAKKLGIKEEIKSPTYAYVHSYKIDNFTLYHYDLYRLKNEIQLLDIDFLENLENSKNILFVEWPLVAESFYKNIKRIEIEIMYDINDIFKRKILITHYD